MSKYRTINEWNHFSFEEAVIGEIELKSGTLTFYLDNVKILDNNSANRDIRTMRCNEMSFAIDDARILTFVEEGYKMYDADGKQRTQVDDREIAIDDYISELGKLSGCVLNSITKEDNIYIISIDTEDHTYGMTVEGSRDVAQWERFLSVE